MAVGDLATEQQVRMALISAAFVLQYHWNDEAARRVSLAEIREALKRIEEAGAA